MTPSPLPPEADLEALKRFDTCIIADAIETFDVRLRNQGYTKPGLRPVVASAGPVIGYAVTAQFRSSAPPILGHGFFAHHGWWNEIELCPQPRMVVIQDIDDEPGAGACVGGAAAAIFHALECVAVVTNGAVRDLPIVEKLGLPLFAAHVSPSHSYAHLGERGQPVEVFGLVIEPGDLLMADRHGVVSIPLSLMADLPAMAADLQRRKRRFVEFCQSDAFSTARIPDEVKQLKP